MHDNMGSRRDPHMKNPTPKYIVIAIIVIILIIIIAPKVYEIYNDNLNDTSNRADTGSTQKAPRTK